MKRFLALLLAAMVVATLWLGVAAAEVESGAIYCFTSGDFSQEELVGICITGLPDAESGTVMLGNRVLRSGDILTAEQIEQMTFVPLRTEEDREALVTYLPIYENRVEANTTMTISIRGKEDKVPVAEDSALETYKNLSNTGSLKANDPEGSALTYTLTRNPRRGEVTLHADGTYTYTPKKNKVGTDSFTFTATDESGKVSREATVTVTILKADSKQQYADTMNAECRFSAEWLKNTGLFVGETINGQLCFQPEKTVNRGEFVAMLVQSLHLAVEEDASFTGFEDDVPAWLRPYLASAMRSGLTANWPHGNTFGADQPITGAEAALLMQNALDLPVTVSAEESELPQWAAVAVMALERNGISLVDSPMTRSQVAVVLYQVSLLAEDAPGMRVLNRQ